jgi:integrase
MAVRERITKALVDAQAPRRREFIVWDEDVPRFGLRVRPAGAKVYVLRLRAAGRQRWYTIGHHGDPWTPDTARAEATRVLGQAVNVERLRATGQAPPNLRHPIEARDYSKTARTLAEFSKRYLEEHARPHKRASSAAADEGNLRRAILPALGKLRLDAITRSEITRFHLSRKDTPTNANRCLALLSHMFTMAEKWGERPDGSNPCVHVDRFPETKRERFLSPAELARLGAAITKLEKAGKVTPYGLAAIRLLVFTGARASEVLGLTWKDKDCRQAVDLDAGVVRIPAKRGPRTLILNPPAAAVLSKLHGVKGNDYVIVGARAMTPLTLSGLEQVWQEVRKEAQLDGVHLHDLRHSFASVAVSRGASLPIIGALLGHTQAATTMRYAHLSTSPLRAESEAVAASIAAAMQEKRPRRGTVVASVGIRSTRR